MGRGRGGHYDRVETTRHDNEFARSGALDRRNRQLFRLIFCKQLNIQLSLDGKFA